MKKLFSTILFLSFLLSVNAYAKDVKLICTDIKDEGISHILIINDNKKTLIVEDEPGFYDALSVGVYNKDEIDGDKRIEINGKVEQQFVYNIDRRTGILTLTSHFFSSKNIYRNISNCKLFKENKF